MFVVSSLSFVLWAVVAIGVHAHPLFNSVLVQRADELSEAYDYVVVGAGASGLTVANRLSQDPGTI
jgi:ribulose 1,5-bisphosphate synthetase/thiazole synthase